MAPESEKGTVNATTTVSGSAPALGGANIRRLQVGLLASLGDEWFNVFFLEKIQVLEAKKTHTYTKKT